jgi:2-polyprenyl-3-methyl-5-hydroxy-6-metoxy-1,4-benzoquinol methylase
VSEWRLHEADAVPEWTTPEWYAGIERAPHLDQPLHRGRLHLAAELARTIPNAAMSTLVDLGAGDGGLLSLLDGDFLDCWGYDLQPTNVAGADQRQVDVQLRDVLTEEILWGNVAACTEMLEHLVSPHAFAARDGYAAMLTEAGWEIVRHETVDIFQVVLAK